MFTQNKIPPLLKPKPPGYIGYLFEVRDHNNKVVHAAADLYFVVCMNFDKGMFLASRLKVGDARFVYTSDGLHGSGGLRYQVRRLQ